MVSPVEKMTADDAGPRPGWQLWIDGGGGFLLLEGNRWTVGGVAGAGTAAVAEGAKAAAITVLADWPRRAGTIELRGDDFFWTGPADEYLLLRDGLPLPVPGSASVQFFRPSLLSGSAVLRVAPPHRLSGHVDGVLLFRDTLLIGRGKDCHVRCPHAESTLVVTRREGRWWFKPLRDGKLVELMPGTRARIGDLALTLQATPQT